MAWSRVRILPLLFESSQRSVGHRVSPCDRYDAAMAPPRKTRRLPHSPAEPAPRRWRRRLLIAAPILLVLYALGGFFGVPWALQRWAVPAANDQLNGSLSVKTFRCNPFALSLTLEGVEVQAVSYTHLTLPTKA